LPIFARSGAGEEVFGMKVKCSICGKEVEISRLDQDYQKLAKHPEAIYFCETCRRRVPAQMNSARDEQKPI
jgi:uncharacterized protein YlaI